MIDYDYGDGASDLRRLLRERVADAFPDGFPSIFTGPSHEGDVDPVDASVAFVEGLGRDDLLTIAWPPEYGGQDLPVWQQLVVAEEMWAHNEPRGSQYYGPNWIGPTIMAFGTTEQQERFLPAIGDGRALWCQGYSEPEAGSDLASLSLRADPIDEGWVLNGQKIWTSYGDFAEWIILPARSERSPDKHDGITVFLLSMKRPGITVRPIRSIGGAHQFNEVFLDDVHASAEDVLGEPGNGWPIVEASLAFERVGTARYARSDRLLTEIRTVMASGDVPDHGALRRQRWIEAALDTRIARLLTYRAVADREAGAPSARAAGAIHRIANTLNDQNVTSTVMELAGPASLMGHGHDGLPGGGEYEHEWRHQLTGTVAAGTLQVQQIVIARELLGRTPRGPDLGERSRQEG